MGFWSYIGLITVIYVAYKFVKRLGKGLPVLELMLLIAGLQWIVGALIEYRSPSMHWKYYMYVEQSTYMGFVVPAYALFSIVVLFVIRKSVNIEVELDRLKNYSNYGVIIFVIGVVFDVLGGVLPGALSFLGFILSNFKFVGAIILYYSENKKLKKIFYVAIIYLLITSIFRALFHDFLLWSVFFYMFYALKNKPSISKVLLTIVAGGLLAATLQTVKSTFRSEVWNNYSGNKLELFVGLMVDSFFVDSTELEDLNDGVDSNVRLNQGWIISAVMDNIPNNQEYLDGATISDAVFASILPRVLNPSKTQAGGRENFRVFTGLEILEASMGISIVGEAYGNFAHFGGIIFMIVWGFFLGKIWLYFWRKIRYNIIFIAFIPLIFLQVIKAETELVVVLNHLIKSMIVVFLFLWFVKKYLKWSFEK
ncbi:hypothetical protein [Gelidibacter gilvus]|uniref:Oligosaccharide repeat unit polymerase n=1 Tax=Gelidibacter gilvus TaxID=59602 RepID=A0A4Q0XG41_9FLAO|nr:hypothetical protein [Gelidibacter gilvus]RXJ46054.1 hypothetical protein ESZ48_13245 [Gelidibacter gilvus]